MEGELIILGFMMLLGNIIIFQMWQMGWFKKENFKIQKGLLLAQNKLQIEKMRKELGLTSKASKGAAALAVEKPSILETVSGLLPLIKSLDTEQVSGLIELILGGGLAQKEELEGIDGLLKFAEDNSDMVEGLLKGFLGNKSQQGTTGTGAY